MATPTKKKLTRPPLSIVTCLLFPSQNIANFITIMKKSTVNDNHLFQPPHYRKTIPTIVQSHDGVMNIIEFSCHEYTVS